MNFDKKKILPIILGAGLGAGLGSGAVAVLSVSQYFGSENPPPGMSYDYCMLKTMSKKYMIALLLKGQFVKEENGIAMYKFVKMTDGEIKELGKAVERYNKFFDDRWQMTFKEAGERYKIKNCKKVLENPTELA